MSGHAVAVDTEAVNRCVLCFGGLTGSAGSPCNAVWTFSFTVSLVSEMTSFAFSTTVPKRRRVRGLSRIIRPSSSLGRLMKRGPRNGL